MAKDKKTKNPPVEAPVVETPEKKEEVAAAATVVDMNATKGLSQHDKLQFATELRHRVSELKEEENPPIALIAGYNMIRDVTFIDLAAGEIACGASAIGYIFSGNEVAYKALQNAAIAVGVTLPEFKSLPAPSKGDLEKVGLAGVSNVKLLDSSAIKVSKEVKDQKKKEQGLIDESKNKDYMKDHTKIETDEQLKEALGFQLVNPQITNPIERLITTAQFYRAYLEAHAEKSDDPQAELAKIHEQSLADLLQSIITMVPPTFITSVFGQRLGRLAHDANSIIPAFLAFKACVTDRKTGKVRYSDNEIAAFVRILIAWYVSEKAATIGEKIKAKEENIKVLKKDAKANAKGIESEEKAIAGLRSSIAHFNEMISLVTDPSFDLADNFIAAYNDKENKLYLSAQAVAKEVINYYYKDVEIPELEFESLLLNIQQRIGIITNLFSSELAYRDEYKEENLISFEASAEKKEEKTAEEKESKN